MPKIGICPIINNVCLIRPAPQLIGSEVNVCREDQRRSKIQTVPRKDASTSKHRVFLLDQVSDLLITQSIPSTREVW